MLRKVYEALNKDSMRGDLVYLTNKDKTLLNINMNDGERETMSKLKGEVFIKQQTEAAAFNYLNEENKSKEKTKDVHFEKLETSPYLLRNNRKSVSNIIFSIRSETLQIKDFHPWKYENDDLCVKCQKFRETIDHFATCVEYETETEANWRDVKLNNINRQEEIGIIIQKRMLIRDRLIEKKEDGQASTTSGSTCSNLLL